MNILYILTQFPKQTETFVKNEIDELIKNNNKVYIYSVKKTRTPNDYNVIYGQSKYIIKLFSFFYWLIFHPISLVKLIYQLSRKNRFFSIDGLKNIVVFGDILLVSFEVRNMNIYHLHSHFAKVATTISLGASKLLNKPFSFTVHAFDIFQRNSDPLLEFKLKESKFINCISEYNRNYLLEHSNLDYDTLNAKIHINHCGISKNNIHYLPLAKKSIFKIVSTGSYSEKKGQIYLIQAINNLISQGHNLHCILIGNGPLKDKFKKIIKYPEQILLLGEISNDIVWELIEESQLFVLPSVIAHDGDRDGIPVSLMEAMARGKVCISTYVSGIPELIVNGKNGFLVAERDVKSLENAIKNVMILYNNNYYEYSDICQNSIDTILTRFSLEDNVKSFIEEILK